MRSHAFTLMLVVGRWSLVVGRWSLVVLCYRCRHWQLCLKKLHLKVRLEMCLRRWVVGGGRLLYIGRHTQDDRIAIWGMTTLTERMTHIILNKSSSPSSMEYELRRNGSVWEKEYKYKNYQVAYAFISDPLGNDDDVFRKVIEKTEEVESLNGHVHTIEEDGTLLDISGREVKAVEKDGVKCAVANKDTVACDHLFFGYSNSNHHIQRLSDRQRQIKKYFEDHFRKSGLHIQLLRMGKDLELTGHYDDRDRIIVKEFQHLKKVLPKDHLIQKIKYDGWNSLFYID